MNPGAFGGLEVSPPKVWISMSAPASSSAATMSALSDSIARNRGGLNAGGLHTTTVPCYIRSLTTVAFPVSIAAKRGVMTP